jgi:hypothetical protein
VARYKILLEQELYGVSDRLTETAEERRDVLFET